MQENREGATTGNTEDLGMFSQFSISFLWVIEGNYLEFSIHFKVRGRKTERRVKGKSFGCFLYELFFGLKPTLFRLCLLKSMNIKFCKRDSVLRNMMHLTLDISNEAILTGSNSGAE